MKNDIDINACVGLDSETCLIRPGLGSPPVVCTAFYYPDKGAQLYASGDQWQPILELFEDQRRLIVLHNGAYDVCCYLEWAPSYMRERLRRAIFQAYRQNRVLDTMLAQRLVEIETGDKRGKLALDQLCSRYGLYVSKEEREEDGREVRLSYGRYLGRPLSEYTTKAREYALGDPLVTWKLFQRILVRGLVSRKALGKLARADLALKATATFGLKTDPERVAKLEIQARDRIATLQSIMLEEKFMRWERGKPQPVRNMAAIKCAVAAAYGVEVNAKGVYTGDPDQIDMLQSQGLLTDGGKSGVINMSTARLVLEESGDPLLMSLAEAGEWAAVWNKDLKLFRYAVEIPFHTRFGFAATTRTTSGGPNIQNFRKKEGIRECIVARFGALVSTDYTGLENATLAQVIAWTLGRKGMADKISSGWDFHAEVGAHIMGITYEAMLALLAAKDKTAKMSRSAAKPLNFGLPGFMQKASTVQSYARIGYGVNLPVSRWQELIDLWYETQHDQVAYLLEYVEALAINPGQRGSLYNVPIPSTDIIRRGATRTAAANTGFQGLGAQVATEALFFVVEAQLLGEMPGRACAFIHDEIISDCAVGDVDEVRAGHERLMLMAAENIMPDVQMKADTVAMKHWSKDAVARYSDSGGLLLDLTH
jgi:hypothetical protein